MISFISAAVFFALIFSARLCAVLPRKTSRKAWDSGAASRRKLAIFLGSGGHTSEALALLSGLDFNTYSPRLYIISEGDFLSEKKATALESEKGKKNPTQDNYMVLTIPRARRVHQSLLSTPPTAMFSLLKCIYYTTIKPLISSTREDSYFADLLILNGPGTCLVLCFAVYLNKIIGLRAPVLIYIESFARVRSLSVSGKLLRYLVDRFIVQWPQLLRDNRRGECHGWLV